MQHGFSVQFTEKIQNNFYTNIDEAQQVGKDYERVERNRNFTNA